MSGASLIISRGLRSLERQRVPDSQGAEHPRAVRAEPESARGFRVGRSCCRYLNTSSLSEHYRGIRNFREPLPWMTIASRVCRVLSGHIERCEQVSPLCGSWRAARYRLQLERSSLNSTPGQECIAETCLRTDCRGDLIIYSDTARQRRVQPHYLTLAIDRSTLCNETHHLFETDRGLAVARRVY